MECSQVTGREWAMRTYVLMLPKTTQELVSNIEKMCNK